MCDWNVPYLMSYLCAADTENASSDTLKWRSDGSVAASMENNCCWRLVVFLISRRPIPAATDNLSWIESL